MLSENDLERLVEMITTHSCPVKAGDKVIVESIEAPGLVVKKLIEKIAALGALPLVQEKSHAVMAAFATVATAEAYAFAAEQELTVMRQAKHFIGLRQPNDSNAFEGLSSEKLRLLLEEFIKPVHYEYRNHQLNWVYLRCISPQMIANSGLAAQDFIAYYNKALLIDYCKLDSLLNPLKERLEKVTSVRILGPGRTDLHFDLGGFGVCKSTGQHNLPDGEIFTAPVRESVNGLIEFNVDTQYYGTLFTNIKLLFNKGRVVEASSNETQKLNDLLDVDEGARFVGEFALGVNPVISTPINDILFDEKMQGSLHLALGNAYPIADNKNRSAIHWDLILGQTPQYGGGEIYFDGQLIRKDGLFLTADLTPLNV